MLKPSTPAQHHLHHWQAFAHQSITKSCSDFAFLLLFYLCQNLKRMQTTDVGTSGVNGRKFQSSFNQSRPPSAFTPYIAWQEGFLVWSVCAVKHKSNFSACHMLLFLEKLSLWWQCRLAAAHKHFICHCSHVSRSRSNSSVYFSHTHTKKLTTSCSYKGLRVQFQIFSATLSRHYASRKLFNPSVTHL